MQIIWVRVAAFFMFVGVVLGAFGAHALKGKLDEDLFKIYQTAVLYQIIHALALFAVAWLSTVTTDFKMNIAGVTFTSGILFFSGSLYLLVFTGVRAWGAVTPIGGLLFLAGWLFILFSSYGIKG